MAAKTTANSSESPKTVACLAIWAASRLCGSPAPENIGSFCPLTSVFIPSMTDIPVWMNSVGKSRLSGFIILPLMSKKSAPTGSGSPSRGLPSPSKTRPSNSSDAAISIVFPKNLDFVPVTERPVVPWKT